MTACRTCGQYAAIGNQCSVCACAALSRERTLEDRIARERQELAAQLAWEAKEKARRIALIVAADEDDERVAYNDRVGKPGHRPHERIRP